LVGGILLHQTLRSVVWEEHQRSLLVSGRELMDRLAHEGAVGLARPLSHETTRRFDDPAGSLRFVVLDPQGEVVLHSPGALPALPRSGPDGLPARFEEGQDGSRLWGLTRRIQTPQGPFDVQIAQDMAIAYVVLDDVAPAALGPVLLLLAAGALILLAANIAQLVFLLRPLRLAAHQAERIGLGAHTRLTNDRLPVEVRPLIDAVNGALDRLDDALAWQRGFSEEVAHELRTPLAIMSAELDLLDAGPAADRLRRDVQDLATLVNDLLEAAEAARDPAVGDDAFDLAELVQEAADRFRPIAERDGRSITIRAPHAPVWVRGNADSIGRALRNLLENAVSHSPPGAPVELRMPATHAAPEAVVEVADHGAGVPQAERKNIFRRFWRAGDTHRRGLGLGLSIVERIVRAHGGRVEVGNNPGGGAVFALHLPTVAPLVASKAQPISG
ncbi:MAG TPA: HAMP domain-containing sensor histidine kinase, partial [Roseomonas sp.]